MSRSKKLAAMFLLFFGVSGYTHAITISFDFTGDCDDCAAFCGRSVLEQLVMFLLFRI